MKNILKSISTVAVGNILCLLVQAFTLRLYSSKYCDGSLSDYMLVLASCTLLSPLINMGLADSILYYIGKSYKLSRESLRNFLQCYICVNVAGLFLFCLFLLGPKYFSFLFFKSDDKSFLALSALLLVISRVSFNLFHRYLLAIHKSLVSAILQLTVMGIIPLIVIIVNKPSDIAHLFVEIAIFTYAVVAIFAAKSIVSIGIGFIKANYWDNMKKFYSYGMPRMPALIGISIMLSSLAIVAKWINCSEEDIFLVGIILTLLRMLGMLSRIMTLIMMPRIAWLNDNNPKFLYSIINGLVSFSVFVGLAIMLMFVVVGDSIVLFWVNKDVSGKGNMVLFFWFSVLPWVIIYFLRPTIDALHSKAYNTLNVFKTLGVMVACLLIISLGDINPGDALAISFLISTIVFAVLCINTVSKLIGMEKVVRSICKNAYLVSFAVVMCGLTFIARSRINIDNEFGWGVFVIFTVVLSGFFFLILAVHFKQLKEVVVSRRVLG